MSEECAAEWTPERCVEFLTDEGAVHNAAYDATRDYVLALLRIQAKEHEALSSAIRNERHLMTMLCESLRQRGRTTDALLVEAWCEPLIQSHEVVFERADGINREVKGPEPKVPCPRCGEQVEFQKTTCYACNQPAICVNPHTCRGGFLSPKWFAAAEHQNRK